MEGEKKRRKQMWGKRRKTNPRIKSELTRRGQKPTEGKVKGKNRREFQG